MYQQEFEAALDRNDRFGLSVPEIAFSDKLVLSDEALLRLTKEYQKIAGQMTLSEVVLQCLSVNWQSAEPISKILGTRAYFTIGYVETSHRNMFYKSEDELRKMLREGVQTPSADLHAWLTFSSMEIIDLTLSSSFAWVNGDKENEGGIIASHPDQLKGGLRFHPMLVGDEFLWECGAFRVEITG